MEFGGASATPITSNHECCHLVRSTFFTVQKEAQAGKQEDIGKAVNIVEKEQSLPQEENT